MGLYLWVIQMRWINPVCLLRQGGDDAVRDEAPRGHKRAFARERTADGCGAAAGVGKAPFDVVKRQEEVTPKRH
jgi:hypothetical protein